jgi:hypothetical protein
VTLSPIFKMIIRIIYSHIKVFLCVNHFRRMKMVDLMLTFFSAILGMNMRDHHDIPFALPLILFIFVGFIISVIVFPFIDDKNEENDTTDISS